MATLNGSAANGRADGGSASNGTASNGTASNSTASNSTASNGSASNGTAGLASARRTELAAFLRARRERILPEDVGLPPGTRRRTAGLRREELAQLAGVGVTWYTWLEQGRKINASVQVLDAIATHAAARRDRARPPVPARRRAGRDRPGRLRRLPAAVQVQQIVDAIPLPGQRRHRAVRPDRLEQGVRRRFSPD